MNWGRSIIIAFILFASFIFYIVYSSMNTHFDLVSENYYKEELEYQKIIDSKQNANKLKEKIAIKVENNNIKLILPPELRSNTASGKIHFYNVTDARTDQQIDLVVNVQGEQDFERNKFVPGNYVAKISITSSGTDYYTEIPVKI